MRIPGIKAKEPDREEIRNFFGLNRQSAAAPGEAADEENVGGDLFPFLSPRRAAAVLTDDFGKCRAIAYKDQPVWITDIAGGSFSKLWYAGHETGVVMPAGKKQIVTMGTKIIVFPDKIYYDTANGESGSLDAEFSSEDGVAVSYTLSRLDGGEYEYDSSPSAPESPADGALWCDTSQTPAVLSKYSASSGMWVTVDSTYVKITSPGIGAAFKEGDGVTVSASAVQTLNGACVVAGAGNDYLIVPGVITAPVTQTAGVTVSRRAPEIDFAVEYSNRIWACRYGLNRDGQLVNEIYASALGDPFNWNAFAGLVSDSYAAGVGSDGPFTGAVAILGYVMFFKERCVHKVFGNRPSNYQIITSNLRGVARGAEDSLAEIDGTLYYCGADGVMAYDGSFPETVSDPLGQISPEGALAASSGKYLYLSALRGTTREFYVFDSRRSVWHREAPLDVDCMAPLSHGVLAAGNMSLFALGTKDLGASAAAACGTGDVTALPNGWYFETGELTAEREDMFVTRVEVTCAVEAGEELRVSLICGEGTKIPVVTVKPSVRRTYSIPVTAPRERRFRLRISGTGGAVVYGVTKFVDRRG